jgi:predicted TIM-barrel fold metal-dependent hydrolase
MRWLLGLGAVLGLRVGTLLAQTVADPALLDDINKIKAVDNHTHVGKVLGGGERDDEYDALPCNIIEPALPSLMQRPENPLVLEAWRKFYGYKYRDMDPEHVMELVSARERVMRAQGDNFPSWVLDQLGTEYMLANRVAMGRGLNPPRFLWVPFDDALMLPLATDALADNPDRRPFYARETALLRGYMATAGVATLPPSLDEYVAKVVTPTLERQRKAGAPAIKFEAAYLRSLDFGVADQEGARRIYEKYATGGVPSRAENLTVQDTLFRTIAREAGRLGMAVHLHTGTGCGNYFDLRGANPLLLESILDDPSLRKTMFVLLHGGSGPYTKSAAFLIGKPNVYADFSEQDALLSARTLSQVLRYWLEWYPEKILYGTDLSPGDPEMDWDVNGYVINATARQALALALTGMIDDGEITRDRALELARLVLRENAVKLYGLGK